MKRILVLFFSLLFLGASAEIVPLEHARNIAQNLYFERASLSYPVAYESISFSEEYTLGSASLPSVYIFNLDEGKGWVIISAESNVYPVLAYSKKGSYTPSEMPPAVEWWMSSYLDGIQSVRDNNVQATAEIVSAWDYYSTMPELNTAKLVTIGPIVKTHWDQGGYYNDSCPGGSVTGCVATMMAQVLKYWAWPEKGKGQETYTHPSYGPLSANFEKTTYKWANMPNTVSSPNPDVAQLMYHCGVSVHMSYSPSGSGANMGMAASAFPTYFRYSYFARQITKINYDDIYWCINIRSNLIDKRPVMYAGGSHAFVCDGFEYPDHFHFNFGWGGSGDGYYYISSIGPSGSYSNSQTAILDVYPLEETATSPFIAPKSESTLENADLFTFSGLQGALTTYPNPAQNSVTLALNSLWRGDLALKVMDALGGVVMTETLSKGDAPQTWDLDISSLTPGLYILQLSNDAESVAQRIVKH